MIIAAVQIDRQGHHRPGGICPQRSRQGSKRRPYPSVRPAPAARSCLCVHAAQQAAAPVRTCCDLLESARCRYVHLPTPMRRLFRSQVCLHASKGSYHSHGVRTFLHCLPYWKDAWLHLHCCAAHMPVSPCISHRLQPPKYF